MAESLPVEAVDPVFVIANDSAVRDSLVLLLETCGFKSVGFRSTYSFLRAFFPTRGCVIYAYQMSDEEDLAALHLLRERRPWLPVIVTVGLIDDDSRARALRFGAADILDTPVADSELVAAVQRVMEPQGGD